ncbi:unnamed protein product [Linum trigynum]|uniref:Uncharacterized protein n=1 Tax=Linum trigynum TaxID=586398 RepID=A0AAV2DM21_9ROSI
MLDYTCRPPRPTGSFVFSGGIQHRSGPFLPIQHWRFRYAENLTPARIQAGTGVFIPRIPIPPPSPTSTICRAVVVGAARVGKKHLIMNGGETSNTREKKDDDYFPDELLPLGLCLPEDWTY